MTSYWSKQRFVQATEPEEGAHSSSLRGNIRAPEVDPDNGTETKKFYESVLATPSSPTLNNGQPRKRKKRRMRKSSAKGCSNSKFTEENLYRSAQCGDLSGLLECLKAGIEVDARDQYGWTALMMACVSGSLDCARALVDAGAAVHATSRSNDTSFTLAEKFNRGDILRLLRGEYQEIVVIDDSEEEVRPSFKPPGKFYCEACEVEVLDQLPKQHQSSIVHQIKAKQFSSVSSQYGLSEKNKGFQMLLEQGWDREQGLGNDDRRGPKYPVKTVLKRDRTGIGFLPEEAARPRVTHFKPFDTSSVQFANERGKPSKAKKKNSHRRKKS